MTETSDPCCGHPHAHDPAPIPGDSPVLVEVTRGGAVESVHHGRACIVDATGRVLASWGDIARPVYPRSSVKPIQAIPLVETGAFDAFGLTDAELALACASHNGEERHTRIARQWLARIGLTAADLECGAHLPYDLESAHELVRANEEPSTVHNNCSGKHVGFLTTAVHRGEPTKGYVRAEHPVQQRVLGVLEQMTGQDLSAAPCGIDGCSIPTYGVPLEALAYAMARIADPRALPEPRAEAVARIRRAWSVHPHLIAGKDSFDTAIMRAAPNQVLVKSGAEGVGCAVLPRHGIGIAVKIDDGTGRARDVALAALIRATRTLPEDTWNRAPDLLAAPVVTRAGGVAGHVRPAGDWPAPLA